MAAWCLGSVFSKQGRTSKTPGLAWQWSCLPFTQTNSLLPVPGSRYNPSPALLPTMGMPHCPVALSPAPGRLELPLGWEQQRRSEAGPRTLPQCWRYFPHLMGWPRTLEVTLQANRQRWASGGQMGKVDPEAEGGGLEIQGCFLLRNLLPLLDVWFAVLVFGVQARVALRLGLWEGGLWEA